MEVKKNYSGSAMWGDREDMDVYVVSEVNNSQDVFGAEMFYMLKFLSYSTTAEIPLGLASRDWSATQMSWI